MRFSLRSLLTLVFLAALMSAVFRAQNGGERAILLQVRALGGVISPPLHTESDEPRAVTFRPQLGESLAPALRLLTRCRSVTTITILDTHLEAEDWSLLAHCPGLLALNLHDCRCPDSIALPRFGKLRSFTILNGYAKLNQARFDAIAAFPRLQGLSLLGAIERRGIRFHALLRSSVTSLLFDAALAEPVAHSGFEVV